MQSLKQYKKFYRNRYDCGFIWFLDHINNKYVRGFIAFVLTMLVTVLGFISCCIGGIYLGIKESFPVCLEYARDYLHAAWNWNEMKELP